MWARLELLRYYKSDLIQLANNFRSNGFSNSENKALLGFAKAI